MTTQYFLKKISMIGREDLLKEFQTWRSDGGFQLAFFHGGYGIGKTYLLQHIANAKKSEPHELIDLYHFKNHTPEGLARAIFSVFEGSDSEEYFKSYITARNRLEAARIAGDGKTSREQLGKLLDSCANALKEISKERGLLLLFDTAERFVYPEGKFAPAWDWMKSWLKELSCGVVLFAGRPEAKHLFEQLGMPYQDKPLVSFTLAQTRAYIQKAGERLEVERETTFNISEDDILKVNMLSEGRPILLAMFLEVRLRKPKATLLNAEKDDFEKRIIEELLSLGDNLDVAIRAAGRTKKGITPELLRHMTGMSLREARDALNAIKEMAFGKIFAGDERVFLHDDMYELLEKYVYNTPADAAEKQNAAQYIYEYYKKSIKEQDGKLGKLFADLIQKTSLKQEDVDTEKIARDVGAIESIRQRLKTEFIYYRLRSQIKLEGKRKAKEDDPVFAGLKMYYRFGHEDATSSNDAILVPLRIELTDFWQGLDDSNAWKPFIEGMLLVNDLWMGIATGEAYDEKIYNLQDKIQSIPEICPDQCVILQALLETWKGTRLIFKSSSDHDRAESILTVVIERLEKLKLETSPLLKWFLDTVTSLAYRQRAYVRRIRGSYKDSSADLLKGLYYIRFSHYYHEEANLRNDLGFTQTLSGDFVPAYENLMDGLQLRHRIAIGHRLALSYSSVAEHFLAKGSFEDTRKYALYAINIASAVGFRRGIAFGNLVYAESTRRLAFLAQDISMREAYLNDAKQAIEHARHLFDQIQEKARIIDAMLEEGCLYRDLARIESEISKKRYYFEKSDALLTGAAQKAEEEKIPQRQVDAACNRIWLGYYVENTEYTEDAINALIKLDVLKPYWLEDGRFSDIETAKKNPALWSQIGKYYVGRGMKSLRDWEITKSENVLLQDAAHFITLGIRYSSEFGLDHRGMREARRTILDVLKPLGPLNLQRFSEYVLEADYLEKIVSMPNEQSQLQKLMRDHALWFE